VFLLIVVKSDKQAKAEESERKGERGKKGGERGKEKEKKEKEEEDNHFPFLFHHLLLLYLH